MSVIDGRDDAEDAGFELRKISERCCSEVPRAAPIAKTGSHPMPLPKFASVANTMLSKAHGF